MEKSDIGRKYGSIVGFMLTVAIGLAFYFLLPLIPTVNIEFFEYSNITKNINDSIVKQVLWFFMNFTEPNFIAGTISSVFLIIGGTVAWRLANRGSRKSGFSICYGNSNMWPWVLATQVSSLLITMYVFRYMKLFDKGIGWVPTFIVVVSTPAAIILTYGPSIANFLTAITLPAVFSTPIAYWMSNTFVAMLEIPGGVSNLLSMGITGFIVMAVCNALPWMEKESVKPIPSNNLTEDVYSTTWFIRRVFAEFTEPHFYGNEIASMFLMTGAIIDWIINRQHGLSGLMGEYFPAIILSQFLSAGVGIFLYAHKHESEGWYPTFVPVVSAAPFCVLAFQPTLSVAIFSAVLGGIIGAPIAFSLRETLPKGIHIFVVGVFAMAISTGVIWAVMSIIPWF